MTHMGEMMAAWREERVAFVKMMQMLEGKFGGGGEPSGGGGGGGMVRDIDGKAFENHKKLKGGDAEWKEWVADVRMLVETRSEALGQILQSIQSENRTKQKSSRWNE